MDWNKTSTDLPDQQEYTRVLTGYLPVYEEPTGTLELKVEWLKSLEEVKEEHDKQINIENNMKFPINKDTNEYALDKKLNFSLTKEEVSSLGWIYNEKRDDFGHRNGHRLMVDFISGGVILNVMNSRIRMKINTKEDLQKLNSLLYIPTEEYTK